MEQKNKKVVYTVITGGYDKLIEVKKEEGFDYICFTDNKNLTSNSWDVRELPEEVKNSDLDGVRKQRKIKVMPHLYLPDYELSVYIDGNVEITGDLSNFVAKKCGSKSGYLFMKKHPDRDCIYEEAEACIKYKKGDADVFKKQIQAYKEEGFPEHYGLTETNVLVRYHNNKNCVKLMEAWWHEIETKSHRDQLSLFYCIWKIGNVDFTLLDKKFFDGEVFKFTHVHNNNKSENGKRILFLVQSCNKERYVNEEQIIRDTWGKRLRKNCDLYFYRGGGKDVIVGDVLSLECGDELNDTFLKTLRALSIFKNIGKYDFIVRTNTSNWVNVDLLLNTIDRMDKNDRVFVGTGAVCNAVSKGVPFLRGNLLIFTKQVLLDLMMGFKTRVFTGLDDVCIGFTLFYYYKTIGVDYFSVLRTIDNVVFDDNFKEDMLYENVIIRCADWIKKHDSSILLTLDKMFVDGSPYATLDPIKTLETYLGVINLNG